MFKSKKPKIRAQQSVDLKQVLALTMIQNLDPFGIDKNKSTQSMKGYDEVVQNKKSV